MNFDFSFFFNSILLGVGLAMDAFSVSVANGLNEPNMKNGRLLGIACVFSGFQFAMPMLGWLCVSTIAQQFEAFEKCIPWIALLLLGYIGGSMIYDCVKRRGVQEEKIAVGIKGLLMQGVATSIDALSVGFTISDHNALEALLASLLIGIVTLFICIIGLFIGRKAGTKLAGNAGILGGLILIFIGLEIFITNLF